MKKKINIYSKKKINYDENSDSKFLKDVNISSLSINLFKYNTLLSYISENFDKNKDQTLEYLDKDLYIKTLIKDLIKNEGWGYEKNYFDENIWYNDYYKNLISSEYKIDENDDYPCEILYNCMNLYY